MRLASWRRESKKLRLAVVDDEQAEQIVDHLHRRSLVLPLPPPETGRLPCTDPVRDHPPPRRRAGGPFPLTGYGAPSARRSPRSANGSTPNAAAEATHAGRNAAAATASTEKQPPATTACPTPTPHDQTGRTAMHKLTALA